MMPPPSEPRRPQARGLAKRFDDPAAYDADIRTVVPGYSALHELAVAALRSSAGQRGTLRVIGCGPGAELVAAARALPGWTIRAVEPSGEMAAAAAARVSAAGLSHRVSIDARPLSTPAAPAADAVLCLLVAHLVPNDGARASFWRALGGSVRPGGALVFAEIEEMDEATRATWLAWSRLRGGGEDRLARLEARLNGGFAVLDAEVTARLAADAGLVLEGLIARLLGVTLSVWRLPGAAAP